MDVKVRYFLKGAAELTPGILADVNLIQNMSPVLTYIKLLDFSMVLIGLDELKKYQ